MTITQAIIEASRNKKGITRDAWMPRPLFLIPTNTTAGILIVSDADKDRPGKRWEPYSDDLTADDWRIYG